jgi:hypothetical protein
VALRDIPIKIPTLDIETNRGNPPSPTIGNGTFVPGEVNAVTTIRITASENSSSVQPMPSIVVKMLGARKETSTPSPTIAAKSTKASNTNAVPRSLLCTV